MSGSGFESTVNSVTVTAAADHVHVSAPVLSPFPEIGSMASRACLDMALFCNARIRGARLAVHNNSLVAESRLHSGQITAEWLTDAARSVAAACHSTAPLLHVLADHSEAADAYCAYFLET